MRQKMHGDLSIVQHRHYKTFFNRKTGLFMRIEEKGFPEPFWSEDGPELLDISITNYCTRNCHFCYRQSNNNGNHMSMSDFKIIMNQAKEAGVLQIALGGGNPNQHPHFIDIIRNIREKGIIPSYTTNGEELSDDILVATHNYCGAMAISLYPPYDRYEEIVQRIASFKIKLNLHIILKKDTVTLITNWLRNPPSWFSNINALIILNYKPIVSSSNEMVTDRETLTSFYRTVSECKNLKIGFDSCCIPGIVTWMNVNHSLIESCEAARFSAFISEDMKMYPCSFMIRTDKYGDLHKSTLKEIWQHNESFIDFRRKGLEERCANCCHQDLCKGGCPIFPEINQCGCYSKD